MNAQQLLEVTIIRKASDLHLIVGYPPTLRVNGELVPINGAPLVTDNDMVGFLAAIFSPLQQKLFEENFELDLAVNFEDKARFRANVYREQNHTCIALRLVSNTIPELETLGLPDVVGKFVDLKQGLILVTGPTGHGKSTTIASMINRINHNKALNILTVEDPVEYIYPKGKSIISQRELLYDTRSWANALKSSLREDPDVVVVGEMRDFDTMSAAVTIAETGHLVLASLHTNSAAQSIDRIIDSFPTNQQGQIRTQLAATLEAIISQRLVPTITPGRVLVVELLLKTPALSSLIRDGKTYLIDNLIQTSAELGMVGFESSLAKLVNEGRVSLEQAYNYAVKPEMLMKLMKG